MRRTPWRRRVERQKPERLRPCELALEITLDDPAFGEKFLVTIVPLEPDGETEMTTSISVNIGHVVNMTIVYLDQNGNPMLTPVVADAPPSWSNSPQPAGAATLVASADGTTATDTAVAAGSDTVALALTVGGVAFSATLGVTIAAAPQVLTSVAIGATVQ
jgi:hypothetical protein